jgi:hypothetical protein
MKLVISLFSALIILAGLLLLINPEIIFQFVEQNMHSLWMYVTAILVRLVIGVMLVLTASQSRFPATIKVLGFLFLIVALIILFMGREGLHHFISSLLSEFLAYARIVGVIAMVFGGFIIYAFSVRGR